VSSWLVYTCKLEVEEDSNIIHVLLSILVRRLNSIANVFLLLILLDEQIFVCCCLHHLLRQTCDQIFLIWPVTSHSPVCLRGCFRP